MPDGGGEGGGGGEFGLGGEPEELGDGFFGEVFLEGMDAGLRVADPEDADDGLVGVWEVAGVGMFLEQSFVAGEFGEDLFAAFGGTVEFKEPDDIAGGDGGAGAVEGGSEAKGGVGLAGAGRLAGEGVVEDATLVGRELAVRLRVAVLFENP